MEMNGLTSPETAVLIDVFEIQDCARILCSMARLRVKYKYISIM